MNKEEAITTKLSAICGCGKTLHSCAEIPPSEIVRWAEAHAGEANHTVLFQGEVRVDKAKFYKPRKAVVPS